MKKRFKTCGALVLALALLMTSVPLSVIGSAHAMLPTVTALTHVNVTVDVPVGGREVSFDVRIGSKPVQGARVFVEQTINMDAIQGVEWWDRTDGRSLKEGDCFITGHEYSIIVYIIVNNPFYYTFSDTVYTKVNGQYAFSERINASDNKRKLNYHFTACEEQPDPIHRVSVYGLDAPIAGRTPDFEAATEHDTYTFGKSDNATNGVIWYNSDTYQQMREDDVFQEGANYTAAIELTTTDAYRFATDSNGSAVTATIMGQSATVYSTTQNESDIDRHIWVRAAFDCVPESEIKGGIDEVRLAVAYPVANEEASFDPMLQSAECYVYDDQTLLTYLQNGVGWYDRTTKAYLGKNDTFQEGHEYTFMAALRINDIMDENNWFQCVSTADGSQEFSLLNAWINGRAARVRPYSRSSMAQIVLVELEFPACNDTARVYTDAAVRDVNVPVIGEKPDTQGTVVLQYDHNGRVDTVMMSVDIQWIIADENGREIDWMEETDVFYEGTHYIAATVVDAGACAMFTVSENGKYNGSYSWQGSPYVECRPTQQPAACEIALLSRFGMPIEAPELLTTVDVIGVVPPVAGEKPYTSARVAAKYEPYVEVLSALWYENGLQTDGDQPFKVGNAYDVLVYVRGKHPYVFSTNDLTGKVNGQTATLTNKGGIVTLRYSFGMLASSSGVTDYVELSDVMRPAPGQHPDFTVTVDSSYTLLGGVSWYELDQNGYIIGEALAHDDTFKANTKYRVEVYATASEGRTINLDTRGATLNNKAAHYYSNRGNYVTVYAEYDTSYCIDQVRVSDVQYPLPGKTPNKSALVIADGYDTVAYADGAIIDWYYETNPGTSAAGFAALDGRFKTDRRHQAFVKVATDDGYWFATDNKGNLAVAAYMDGVPMSFAYATDSYVSEGAVNSLEFACTFERAKDVDGVFLDGMLLMNGMYLDSDHRGVQTEDTVDKDVGYAYYEDGVLALCDFEWTARGDYNTIESYRPLTIQADGVTLLGSSQYGISTNAPLMLSGDGEVNVEARYTGVFAMDTLTVNSGVWNISAELYEGIWLYTDMVINGGSMHVYGRNSGVCGDDQSPVTFNGGELHVYGSTEDAIAYCVVTMAPGTTVKVAKASDDSVEDWDGQTAFYEYAYVGLSLSEDVLLGDVNEDGEIDMRDAFSVYKAASGGDVTDKVATLGDMNADGEIDMRDAFAVYKIASGAA